MMTKEEKKEYMKEYRIRNRQRLIEYKKAYDKEYYEKNRERIVERTREYYQINRETVLESMKIYQQENQYSVAKRQKSYRENNREILNIKKRLRRLSNPKNKLIHSIGVMMRQSLKLGKCGRHWESLVGYTVDQLKQHLEKWFDQFMTWGNYGTYWHIDHIIPIAAFNFETPEDVDFKRCWALKNLRPLEAKENIRKSDKVEKPFQPSLLIGI